MTDFVTFLLSPPHPPRRFIHYLAILELLRVS